MTTQMMSMGWQQRRRNTTGTPSPVERLVVLGLIMTLTLTAVLVITDSTNSDSGRSETAAATENEAIDASAVVVPAATPAFVESASPQTESVAIGTPDPGTTEINGFEAFTEEPGLYQVAGDSPVNIRVLPGVDSATVGQIALGDAMLAFGTGQAATNGDETWMQVDYAGVSGWVRSDLMNPADAN